MSNNKPVIDADGEVRELTAGYFNKIKPLSFSDPALFKMLKAAKASTRRAGRTNKRAYYH